jgi:glycosyltransferase involved in cell wall biosynthesis
MIPAPKADVIIPWEERLALVVECIESVLEYGGPALGRLLLVADSIPDLEMAALKTFAGRDPRFEIVPADGARGFAARCNQGISRRAGDAVLLRGDCSVTRDWLLELAAVAQSDERTACASPLVNGGGTCSIPELFIDTGDFALDDTAVLSACAGLPRWTAAPLLSASCIYLRGDVIDAVGLLDPSFFSPSAAVNNWVLRAQSLGFSAKRSNHAHVRRLYPNGVSECDGEEPDLDLGATLSDLDQGEHLDHQINSFRKTLDGHLAAHAVRVEATGKLRVACDLRHLPKEHVGTRTYAVCLCQALAELPDLELTLLVNDPSQAAGLTGRVVTAETWQDDVEVIHKPAQVIETSELALLFGSKAHLVMTYQDLIGYQIPLVFPDNKGFDRYRATSSLTLPAVQRVLAYSENTKNEIATEFGIPTEDIAAVPLGVDSAWFAHSEPDDFAIPSKLKLPARYFFSLATDFPHKNLPNLLDAYEIMRSRWRDGEPPGLVLAGYKTGGRRGVYPELVSRPLGKGLVFLGAVSGNQLRVLYQRAVGLVFPSLYEGFGLPPLEAMAAGTPVIAMPISAMPEVAGECVLFPKGLSPDDLARSMELLATSEALHEGLRSRGLRRARDFRWESTARATLEVYRATVRNPSDRSLQMRRLLTDAIFRWASDPARAVANEIAVIPAPVPLPELPELPEPIGIKNALKALNSAISARLKREIQRLPIARPARTDSDSVPKPAHRKVLLSEKTV